ncbi:MAG: TAXI family TRAP transporter solute-binding subunit [Alphaproteobacteria bacterium]|nr:TAXI family TRAP transporter solute-binding subunit [Alphaproteobacteria bacterium]
MINVKTLVGATLALALAAGAAAAQQQFFRIGTGGTAGTYYPIGGIVANAISESAGQGVKGLVATAVASNGSLANVNSIVGGSLESGFSQSDVAYWAWSGTGLFEGKTKVDSLRLIANLYPESIHIVARKDSGIKSVADLKGKRVSLDEPGSGTLVDARIVLAAYGLGDKDLKAEYIKTGPAADRMKDGGLDAFFFVGGYPGGAISELASTGAGITLVPIAGAEAQKILSQYRFFAEDTIPADIYKGTAETKTLSVGAQWVTSTKADETLIYNIVKAMWNDNTRKLLDAGHAKGKVIQLKTAVAGAGIPFHPGAAKFYKEIGLLK